MVTGGHLVHASRVSHLRRRVGVVLLWPTADFAQLSGDGKSISLERTLIARAWWLGRLWPSKSHRPAAVAACFASLRVCRDPEGSVLVAPDRDQAERLAADPLR